MLTISRILLYDRERGGIKQYVRLAILIDLQVAQSAPSELELKQL